MAGPCSHALTWAVFERFRLSAPPQTRRSVCFTHYICPISISALDDGCCDLRIWSVQPQARCNKALLGKQPITQLERLLGPRFAKPLQLYIKDWAFDRNTATRLDQTPLYAHPEYGLLRSMTAVWDGTLRFSGTEGASRFGGCLGEALEAAENTLIK